MSEISAWMYLLDYMQKMQEKQTENQEYTNLGHRLPQRGQRGKKGGGKKKPGKK
jgi:hypothetical protein